LRGAGGVACRTTTTNFEPSVSDTDYVLEKVVMAATYWHEFRQGEAPVQMPHVLPNLPLKPAQDSMIYPSSGWNEAGIYNGYPIQPESGEKCSAPNH
jgi:hypothetical protein